MSHPHVVVWPRRAVLVIESLAGMVAAALLTGLAMGVSALLALGAARPFLAVASGFMAGALTRLAKDARRLAGTYRSWRRHQLDRFCAHRETRRARRRWVSASSTGRTKGEQP